MDEFESYYTSLGSSVLEDSCSSEVQPFNPLRSRLLGGTLDYDYILEGMKVRAYSTGEESNCDYQDERVTGAHIWRIQVALKIAIPEEDTSGLAGFDAAELRSWDPSSEFDHETASWLAYFQEAVGLEDNGELDADTLRALDNALLAIRYYDVDSQKTIHNFSTSHPVGKHTVAVNAGAIRDQPIGSATVLETMVVNDLIYISSLVGSGWAFVIGAGGNEGYCALTDLWTYSEMPCSIGELYEITEADDEMLDLVEKFYKRDETEWTDLGIDKRFFANMLLYLNNPGGGTTKTQHRLNSSTGKYDNEVTGVPTALYLKQETTWFSGHIITIFDTVFDLFGEDTTFDFRNSTYEALEDYWASRAPAGTVWDDWTNVVLVRGKNIWVPSTDFAYTLLDIVNRGKHPANLIGRTIDQINITLGQLRGLLDDYWPIGMGYRIDASIGATFGIPLAVDLDATFYMWRDSRDKFKLVRRGIIGGGLDAGIGAGGFFGLGAKDPDKISQKENWGIGAGLAANVYAGKNIGLVQEMEFDISSNTQIMSLMFICMGGEAAIATTMSTPMTVTIGQFLTAIVQFGLSPYDFTTLLRFTYAEHYEAQGTGYLGLRFGDTDETTFWNSWVQGNPLDHDLGGNWIVRMVMYLFSLKGGISFGFGICTGFVIRFQESERVSYTSAGGGTIEDTVYTDCSFESCSTVTLEVYVEGQLFSNNGLNFFGFQLPSFLQTIAFGMGVKLSARFDLAQMITDIGNGSLPAFPTIQPAIYEIGGDLDVYNGTGHEHVLEINPPSNWNNLTPSSLKASLGAATIFERVNLAASLGTKYKVFSRHVTAGAGLIKDDLKVIPGITSNGYLDYKYRLPALAVQDIVDAVIQELIRTKGWAVWDAVLYLWKYLWGTPHNPIPPIVSNVVQFLHNNYQASFHQELGLGAGIGGKVGAGGKIRFQAMGSFSLIYHMDLNKENIALTTDRLEDLYGFLCAVWEIRKQIPTGLTMIPMY